MTTAEEKLDGLAAQMKALLLHMEQFNHWCPEVDQLATDLTKEVKKLTSRVEALEAQPKDAPPHVPPREEEGPAKGLDDDLTTQGLEKGTLVLKPHLANGQFSESPPHTVSLPDPSQYYHVHHPQQYQKEVRLPKALFPKFDGTNPKSWKEKCEKYFNMYHVPMHLWAQFATIHFHGSAELWLQTYEAQHSDADIGWVGLCIAVDLKFGRDLYHNAMNDLLQIKQHADVQEYFDRFQTAMHKVIVHNKSLDDVFFVSKFLQGLKPDISAAIMLHKPRTVDAAPSLALMQAHILEGQSKPQFNRLSKPFNKFQGKSGGNNQPGVLGNPRAEDSKPKWDDKLQTLRSHRRAQGLCMTCGEKWSMQHKCPEKVSLHVLEEVINVMKPADSDADSKDDSSSKDEEVEQVFSLSSAAIEGIQGRKTIRMHGMVNNHDILILLDSGSSCTFISTKTVDMLRCPVTAVTPVSVTVANGNKVTSDKQV